MQEEILEQQENEESLFTELLFLVRKNIVLMMAIIIFVTSLGVAYALVRKPNYTARVDMCLLASSQKVSTWQDGVNTTQNYLPTMVDFCDEGVVVDRANYYYLQWINQKSQNPQLVITDFIKEIDGTQYNNKYVVPKEKQEILQEKIEAVFLDTDGYVDIVFYVNYTDSDKDAAENKAQILAKAIEDEAQLVGDNGEKVYFKIALEKIESKGTESITVDISKVAIVFVSGVVGVLIALLVLYLKTILDNGIKTKEELEKIMDVQVLGCIDDIGGKKNGSK